MSGARCQAPTSPPQSCLTCSSVQEELTITVSAVAPALPYSQANSLGGVVGYGRGDMGMVTAADL